jgi:hypothetical protein
MADENKGIVAGLQGNPKFSLFAPVPANASAEERTNYGVGGLFKHSRMLHENQTAPPSTQRQNTGVECPECKTQGVVQNPVWSVPNVGLQCSSGHRFRDTESLMARPHGTVPVGKREVMQEGWVEVKFQLPGSVAAELRNKYQDKDKLDATFAALCGHMIEPNMIMLGEPDIRRIADKVGQSVRSGQELYGIIFSLQENLNSTRDELRQKQANTPERSASIQLRRGEVIIWLSPPNTTKLTERAKGNGLSNEEQLEKDVTDGYENGWWA